MTDAVADLRRLATLAGRMEEIRIMRLQPGDVIVVRTEVGVVKDEDDAKALRDAVAGVFPGHEIVLAGGVELDVVRPEVPLTSRQATGDPNA